jgi:hypothetical protein
MKKIIFTESQIKKLVNNVIKEQSEERSFIIGAQKFLNIKYPKANLKVDGLRGPESRTDIFTRAYQKLIGAPIDGVFGELTYAKMPPADKKLWDKCQQQDSIFDTIGGAINKGIGKLF